MRREVEAEAEAEVVEPVQVLALGRGQAQLAPVRPALVAVEGEQGPRPAQVEMRWVVVRPLEQSAAVRRLAPSAVEHRQAMPSQTVLRRPQRPDRPLPRRQPLPLPTRRPPAAL